MAQDKAKVQCVGASGKAERWEHSIRGDKGKRNMRVSMSYVLRHGILYRQ